MDRPFASLHHVNLGGFTSWVGGALKHFGRLFLDRRSGFSGSSLTVSRLAKTHHAFFFPQSEWADAWNFFTCKNAPEEDKWRFKNWSNEVALRSLEMYSEYEPRAFIERIALTPLVMVVGEAHVVRHTDLALAAFNRAGEPSG